MKFLKMVTAGKAEGKPNLQVVQDKEDGQGVPNEHKQVASAFFKWMENFIDHKPSPKEFAHSLLHLMEVENAHGDHHLTLNSYAKAEFDAVSKFLAAAKKEIETMFNKERKRRKK